MQAWSNWSGSVAGTPHGIERPGSEEELIAFIRESCRALYERNLRELMPG